jgi:hypothetical protein
MFDLSTAQSVPVSRYDLSKIDIQTVPEDIRKFVKCLLDHRQVMFHWGLHGLYACTVPYDLNERMNQIVQRGTDAAVHDDDWIQGDPEKLHESLRQVFSGDWSPIPADLILRLENSGIRVDLYGTENFGPEDPKQFMEDLRKRLPLFPS